MARGKSRQNIANLRVCASCEFMFKYSKHKECPKCQFASYGAHWVYGKKCYQLYKTQEPWMKKKLRHYQVNLIQEVKEYFKNG